MDVTHVIKKNYMNKYQICTW